MTNVRELLKYANFASGAATTIGNTTILTATTNKKIRLLYIHYNVDTAMIVFLRWGTTGDAMFKNDMVANSIFGANLVGANVLSTASTTLAINCSTTGSCYYTVFYREED